MILGHFQDPGAVVPRVSPTTLIWCLTWTSLCLPRRYAIFPRLYVVAAIVYFYRLIRNHPPLVTLPSKSIWILHLLNNTFGVQKYSQTKIENLCLSQVQRQQTSSNSSEPRGQRIEFSKRVNVARNNPHPICLAFLGVFTLIFTRERQRNEEVSLRYTPSRGKLNNTMDMAVGGIKLLFTGRINMLSLCSNSH